MKRPKTLIKTPKEVQVYVIYLESLLEKYNHEKEKAESYIVLKKQLGEINTVVYAEKSVTTKNGDMIVNDDVISVTKDITRIIDQMDQLKGGIEKEALEKAEKSLKTRTSIKGDHAPENYAERALQLKREQIER